MTLAEWISGAVSLVAIVLIFIPNKIHFGSVMDHLGELDQAGKPVPNQWMVRQARRNRMLRWALVAVASGGLINAILKILGRD
ncbi:MAG: hypothetical protein NT006_02105 [Candidatus Aminicenantes bacterium]|nr:hypothetical protein [Candidatus Aminicenantes bacterium]